MSLKLVCILRIKLVLSARAQRARRKQEIFAPTDPFLLTCVCVDSCPRGRGARSPERRSRVLTVALSFRGLRSTTI